MFARELRSEGHVKRFSVRAHPREGWEVREEHDNRILKQVCYTDWHRVERALTALNRQIVELEASGWRA